MPASTTRATSIYGASLSRTLRSPARPKRAAPAWNDSVAGVARDPPADPSSRPAPQPRGASSIPAFTPAPRASKTSNSDASAAAGAARAKPKMTKAEYGRMIGVGPKQRRPDRDPDAAAVKDYDAFADVEAGWRLSSSRPEKSAVDIARETGAPRVMYTADPKYRMRSADGKYLGVVDLSEGEAPAPGSAAAKAAAPPKPVKSTGDPRLDAKRAKAKAEAERRETERAHKAKAKEKARREAAAARSSIAAAEVQFYRDTVSEMAKNYNAIKLKADGAAKELAGLETDYVAQREANRLLALDHESYRGGGGAIHGAELPARAGSGPAANLEAEQLEIRVREAEVQADLEQGRTESYGHMIIRMREGDPTTEERRENPHLSFKTSKATATAAGNSANSSVPWMNRKLEVVKQFQADIQSEIDARRSQLYRAQNEQAQAEAMLARTIQSTMDRRENWADQLGQRRSFLLASRAEEKAMAAREKAFKKQLLELAKTLEEEEQNKKRGGKAVLAGVKGNNARGFLAMMDRQALRAREADVDHALQRLQAIIPDITPDGLVEGFLSRRERVAAVRDESVRAQAKHDELAATRKALADQLEAVKAEVFNVDAKDRDPLGGRAGRPEDVADSKVYRAENRVRMTRLILEDREKELTKSAASIHNLMSTVRNFERSLMSTPTGEEIWRRGEAPKREKATGKQSGLAKEAMRRSGSSRNALTGMHTSQSKDSVASGVSSNGRGTPAVAGPRSGRTTPTGVGGGRSVAATSAELMNREAREGIVALAAFFDKLDRANVIAAADVHKQLVEEAARKQGVHPSKVLVSSLELEHAGEKPEEFYAPEPPRQPRAATTAEADESTEGGDAPRSAGGLSAGGSSKSVVFDENVPPDAPRRSDSPKPKLSRGPARIVRQFSSHNLRVLKPETAESSDDEEEKEEAAKEEREARDKHKAASVGVFRKKQPKHKGDEWARETERQMEVRALRASGGSVAAAARRTGA